MSAATVDNDCAHSNEVHLVGRVAATPELMDMPSGDELVTWRLVVERPPRERLGRRTVDVVDCNAYLAKVRRSVSTWNPGDIVEVEGALRRRFYRTPAGQPASRYSVQVTSVRRLSRAR
jgi:single-strand DNA-binding protein